MNSIPKLTDKEEEVMARFWLKGPLTVREVVAAYDEPQPHFNTISTYVHNLEKKGYLVRNNSGNALLYSPAIARENYRQLTMRGMIRRLFDNSYLKIVSSLVQDEKISVEELKQLIDMVEKKTEPPHKHGAPEEEKQK